MKMLMKTCCLLSSQACAPHIHTVYALLPMTVRVTPLPWCESWCESHLYRLACWPGCTKAVHIIRRTKKCVLVQVSGVRLDAEAAVDAFSCVGAAGFKFRTPDLTRSPGQKPRVCSKTQCMLTAWVLQVQWCGASRAFGSACRHLFTFLKLDANSASSLRRFHRLVRLELLGVDEMVEPKDGFPRLPSGLQKLRIRDVQLFMVTLADLYPRSSATIACQCSAYTGSAAHTIRNLNGHTERAS